MMTRDWTFLYSSFTPFATVTGGEGFNSFSHLIDKLVRLSLRQQIQKAPNLALCDELFEVQIRTVGVFGSQNVLARLRVMALTAADGTCVTSFLL